MRACGVLLASIAVLGVPLSAPAQEKEIRLFFEGPEVFCHILHQLDLQPLARIDEIGADPSQTVVILFGNPRILREKELWPMELAEFAGRGGNILIATDHPYEGFGVKVTGTKIVQREGRPYGDDPRCPWLPYQMREGFEVGAERNHPIFFGLNKGLATNCPSHVRSVDANSPLMRLLDFPGEARPVIKRSGKPVGYMAGTSMYFQPGHDLRLAGRVLVIAGHGVFMNGMMLQTDNDNFDFAINMVRWLREGSKRPRTKALFIVDGTILNNFNMNLSPPAPPIPVPTVTWFNRLIRGLEDERFFHQALGNLLDGDWNPLLRVLFGVTTLLLVGYGAKKLLQGRHAPETAAPSMVGAPVIIDVVAPALEARRQAVMRKTDYGTPARTLVHDWFQHELDIAPEQWHASGAAEFQVLGSIWSRWRLKRQASFVLRLASAAEPTRLSRHEFFRLISALQDLGCALRDGQATLLIDGKIVRQR
jgi:hypothetical protein